MKKLYLHIGLGKTGSSALQSWLSMNAENLSEQGIDYADLAPHAKHGDMSSGNGLVLVKAIRANDYVEVERLLTTVYFLNQGNESAIVSSELLKDVRHPKLVKIQEICRRNKIDIVVVAYIRSVYERAYSAYGQSVKMSGETNEFSANDVIKNLAITVSYLRKYAKIFGSDVVLLNYDDPQRDIYTAFAAATVIDIDQTEPLDRKVNRSLTVGELQVQRLLNKLHNGIFSAPISRHLIRSSPDRATQVLYDHDVLVFLREDLKEPILWINDHFNLTPPLTTDLHTEHDSIPEDEAVVSEVVLSVVEWALQYQPEPHLLGEFEEFLTRFAVLVGDYSDEARSRVLTRL